jgi:hypothetical protein
VNLRQVFLIKLQERAIKSIQVQVHAAPTEKYENVEKQGTAKLARK